MAGKTLNITDRRHYRMRHRYIDAREASSTSILVGER
jgi:hypothetical protein